MNDLKNGILDINGFLVQRKTKVEELEHYFSLSAEHSDPFAWWNLNNQLFVNEGISFTVFITFDEGDLKRILLRPQFPEIAAKYDLTPYSDGWLPYFQELRVIMDEWLEKQLGEPTRKNSRNTTYQYGDLMINTCAYIDDRARDYVVHGGSVDIYYE